jgi:hypothetical protein
MGAAGRRETGRGVSGTDGLVEFLRARLDEDAAVARAASGHQWDLDAGDGPAEAWVLDEDMHLIDTDRVTAEHIARWDPARVLAEVEAKRQMIRDVAAADASSLDMEHGCCHEPQEILAGACRQTDPASLPLLRLLAVPYAGHPDYRDEWRVVV